MIVNPDEKAYSDWWNKAIHEAKMLDNRYKVKGMFVWLPYGFSLMKSIRNEWDQLFEKNGIEETYFPLLVPEEYAKQNEAWWDSFKEQAFYALGFLDKEKNVFLRPTGEPAMYPMFSLWIRSHRDLPLRIYETVSAFRNETKSTKVLVRDVEIGPWYEIHTVHATKEEAEKEIELAVEMNDYLFDLLAVARLKVRKPQYDCFPGSVGAVEFYTLMNDKVVENTSCNNLGQAYAKAFNIKFVDEKEKEQFAYQTCTGNGERFLAAMIANHADEKGIVVPPKIAPTQVALVLLKVSEKEVKGLEFGVEKRRVKKFVVDNNFGEIRYGTEKMGVPVRVEIGPKELKDKSCLVAWRNGKKETVKQSALAKTITSGLEKMQKELLAASEGELARRVKECKSKEEAKKAEIAVIGWCMQKECADWLQADLGKELIGMTLKKKKEKCLHCQKEGEATYFSKSY